MIRLNFETDRVKPLVMVSQYDTARTIEFELYDNETRYIPSNATILIGTNQYQGTITNGIVYFTVPSSLTQNAQKLFGEIVVNDNGRMATCNFNFVVDSTPLNANTLSMANRLANGLKMGLETKIEPTEEQKDEPIEEPIEEPTEEVVEEPTEEEPIEEEAEPIEEPVEEEPTEEPIEEETEPIEEENEDELVNDNTDD